NRHSVSSFPSSSAVVAISVVGLLSRAYPPRENSMKRTFFVGLAFCCAAHGAIMISGNENKIDLMQGKPKFVPNSTPDTLTILDFAASPPREKTIDAVSNSVVG